MGRISYVCTEFIIIFLHTRVIHAINDSNVGKMFSIWYCVADSQRRPIYMSGFYNYSWGPRFQSLCGAYDPSLRRLAQSAAGTLGLDEILREGVYTMVSGPCFETVSEAKAFRRLGADCMGTSSEQRSTIYRNQWINYSIDW